MNTASGGSRGARSKYTVLLDKAAKRDLNRLETSDFKKVDQRIVALAGNPRPYGVEKLKDDLHRIRVGDWRVIYVIEDEARRVLISRVKRRGEDTYKNL